MVLLLRVFLFDIFVFLCFRLIPVADILMFLLRVTVEKKIWIANPTLFYELCHLYIYRVYFLQDLYVVSLFSLLRCFFETKVQFQCYN